MPNLFIVAQGPKEDTVNDFWRMVLEQGSDTIAMLSGQSPKCMVVN